MIDGIISTDGDKAILGIVDIFELTFAHDSVTDEVTVFVIQQSSLERSGVDYWAFYHSSVCEGSGVSEGTRICSYSRHAQCACTRDSAIRRASIYNSCGYSRDS